MSNKPAVLYVVATPIGNLGDITARAAETLRDADLIAAEDTRHSRRLLQHLGVSTPMISLHEHNERQQSARIVERVLQGETVALIADAGTPLISDPGFRLVRAAHAAGIAVKAVPGACAAITALSIAGLPTDRFVFEGFLSSKAGSRRSQLEELVNEPRTMVFYVAPRRLADDLHAMVEVMGAERQAVLARELTKAFETVYTGSVGELLQRVHVDADMNKGEMVLLVEGAPAADDDSAVTKRLLAALLDALPLKSAVDVAVRATGGSRNSLYQQALELQSDKPAKDDE